MNHWRVSLGDNLVSFGAVDSEHARDVLGWLGERLSPLDVITGPDELDRAPVGSRWTSEYNNGNRYRKRDDDKWEYKTPNSSEWRVADAGICSLAYPLTKKA
jgi:hypothetical protein